MEKRKIAWLIPSSSLIGFINGFFGGGGGMFAVPILIYVLKLEERKAHATALLIILPLTIASSIMYMLKMPMDVGGTIYAAIGTTIGGVVGAFLLKKAKNIVLQIIFILVMLAAGIYMLI